MSYFTDTVKPKIKSPFIFGTIFSLLLVILLYGLGTKCCNLVAYPKSTHVTAVNSITYENIDKGVKKQFKSINLDTTMLPLTNKGDYITLKLTLPNNDYESPILGCLFYHAAVNVYLENELIYTYNNETDRSGPIIGSGYHFISLPDGSANRELTINLKVSENNAFTTIDPFILNSSKYFFLDFIHERIPPILFSIFLIGFGLILLIITTFMIFVNSRNGKLYYISFSAIFCGLWTICNYKVIQLFSNALALNTVLEYVSLYFMPIPFFFYLYDTKKWNKINKWIYKLLIGFCSLFNVIAIILHTTDTAHFCTMLPIYHIMMVISAILILYSCINCYKLQSKQEQILFIGFVQYAVTMLLELARFNLQKYQFANTVTTVSFLPLGAVLLNVFLMMSYCMYISELNSTEVEQAFLLKLAYKDPLTGLANRAKCEELLTEYEKQQINYLIINFDLNELKLVNDHHGHTVGDHFLNDFATALIETFHDVATIGRMGGDEFIIISDAITSKKLPYYLHLLDEILEKKNRENPLYRLSTALGYAFSTELEKNSYKEIYNLADERMYENKILQKMNQMALKKEAPNE